MYLYRFRTSDSLLGDRQELEKQTIYFASLDQLNDPLEGLKNIYWDGDEILWHNLFKHYFYCLYEILTLHYVLNEELLTPQHINIFGSAENLHPKAQNDFTILCSKLFLHQNTISLLNYLSNKKITKIHLMILMRTIHSTTILPIINNHIKRSINNELNYSINNLLSELELIKNTSSFETALKQIVEKQNNDFISFNYKSYITKEYKRNSSLILDFIETYLTQLEKLIYPKWYTACFMEDCKNSASWGHYANSHTGMCLKFEPKEENDHTYLNINHIVGQDSKSEYTWRFTDMPLDKIKYNNQYEDVDFFNYLGTLTAPQYIKWCYLDKIKSEKSLMIYDNEEEWRNEYWGAFKKTSINKLDAWSYEKEWRLVLQSNSTDLSIPAKRTTQYNFNQLNGIIFGIKTKLEDKLKTIQIIKNKCLEHKRESFNFYQAYYCNQTRKIEHYKIELTD